MPNSSHYPFNRESPKRRLIFAGRCKPPVSPANSPRGSVASREAIVSAPGDVSTRGRGVVNWRLYGLVLMRRQLELDYLPHEDDPILMLAIERRVARELYPTEEL